MQLATAALKRRPVSRGILRGWYALMRPASLRRLPHNPKVAGSNPAPATFPLALSVLTGGDSVLVHRVANPTGAMRISRRIRRRLPARSSGPVRSLPFVEAILTRSCPRICCAQRAAALAGSDDNAVIDGDFAMLESELQDVLKALHHDGINIVSIHSHMSGEQPRVLFLPHSAAASPARRGAPSRGKESPCRTNS
jgi:Domain of Unknown Function (DUF1259)